MTKIEVIRDYARRVASMEGFEIGDPLYVSEITFIPILQHEIPRAEREYLTLAEALEEGLCRITEKGTEVAHIIFENVSKSLPILIEEGDIFQGLGTQDRIAVGTIMVEPGAKVEISVKCVHAPHALHRGAAFGYSGKASRLMLNKLRHMKSETAKLGMAASTISQSEVWSTVSEEAAAEVVSDQTKYHEVVMARKTRSKERFKDLNFPENTVGITVVDSNGKLKAIEIHRSPRNFRLRKASILESIEATIQWEAQNKAPFTKAEETVKNLFKKLTTLEEDKDTHKQIEIDGLVINAEGISGEAFTTAFYSGICPECGKSKPRKKSCPTCGFEETVLEEVAYMSLM